MHYYCITLDYLYLILLYFGGIGLKLLRSFIFTFNTILLDNLTYLLKPLILSYQINK